MSEQEVGFYELVKGVREELKKIALDQDIQQNPLLILKNIELNLNAVISRATEAGIRFYIITAGAKHTEEKLTSIKLVFEPIFKIEPVKTQVKVDEKFSHSGGSADY